MVELPWIERVQVDEGFIDGLDLELVPGLNVVIGARGTGKTSLLELIRFALGAPAFTDQAARASDAQVRAVLGRGRVKLTIRLEDEGALVVSRSVGAEAPISVRATVLAQNEIEAVGASDAGRLHLLDRFWENPELNAQLVRARSKLKANSKQVRVAAEDLHRLREQIEDTPELETELTHLENLQKEVLERTSATDEQRNRLNQLQAELRQTSLRTRLVAQAESHVDQVRLDVSAISGTSSPLPHWPDEAGLDPTIDARRIYDRALSRFVEVSAELGAAVESLGSAANAENTRQSRIEEETRALRQVLGALDAEAAAYANRISEVSEQLGSRRAVAQLAAERAEQLEQLLSLRDEVFGDLDRLRDARFVARQDVAESLNAALGPSIRIETNRSGATEEYEDAIVAGLRGSGLHRTLAPALAGALSPIELVKAAEAGNSDFVARATGLSSQRVASALRELVSAIPELVSCDIDDTMELYLLDGTSYKASGALSIGQRCTTVLPILLQRRGDVLVIDQPEDHLDNAFVTSTLVQTLRSRQFGEQVILASHNANIPVLGEADLVIHLSSDGSRGFVKSVGPLDDAGTVQAITDVMEGGAEAFRQRADFYGRHSGAQSV